MIVLDEELQGLGLEEAISSWYHGSVLLIKALRPGTVIKDEAIAGLLHRVRQPTFVTINHGDFWRRVAAEKAFCLLCLKLAANQAGEVSHWLRRLFGLSAFKTKRVRMGKVALISPRSIQYYSVENNLTHLLGWSTVKQQQRRK